MTERPPAPPAFPPAATRRPRGPWAPLVDAAIFWGIGLLSTPLAGAIGGIVIWAVMVGAGVDAELVTGFGFAVFGGIIGSMLAAPVTLIVLPVTALVLCVIPGGGRWAWWLPVLGAVAGGMSMIENPGGPDTSFVTLVPAIAGSIAGMVAGVLFAPVVRMRGSPRAA